MPTTQVLPGSDTELQDIANSLWKSRKVVVITGAGISTNSGIPDFRSEGGLYSLIQQQFDAAAAADAENANSGDSDECDRSSEVPNERPVKRRRLSRDASDIKQQGCSNGDSIEVAVVEEVVVAEIECRVDHDTSVISEEDASKLETARESIAVACQGVKHNEDVVMADTGLPIAPDPSDEPPGGPRRNPSTPYKMGTGHMDELAALTPLPSPFISRPMAQSSNSSTKNGTAGQAAHLTSSPPSLTHDHSRFPSDSDQSFPHTVTSSPLSSPPTFLYDPYQQASRRASASPSPSSSQDSSSASSQSESSSSSTPVLTSQSSFTSFASRNSLPNMKGKDLFDAQIWSCPKQTSVFYTFITSLRQKVRDAEPTTTHRFVSILRDSRKLVRCYTQNIDQLEERVGLSTSLELGPGSRYRFSARSGRTSGGARGPLKEAEPSSLSQVDVMEDNNVTPSGTQTEADSQSTLPSIDGDTKEQLSQSKEIDIPLSQASTSTVKPPPNRGVECVCVHGSLAQLRCFVCGRTASWDEESRESDTLAGRQPKCPHCERATAAREERGKRALGIGKLRPDIVLYGEAHPQDHLIDQVVRHDLSLGPDMLLILGTSLRVHGLKTLVREFAKTVHDRGGKVVFVNFTKPPDSVWSDFIDYWVQWDCDAWVSDIEKRKPALWLPPGTVLPEDEKAKKAPKAPRKSNGGEATKPKDESAGPKARRTTANGAAKKGRPKKEASSITVSGSQEEGEVVTGLEIAVAGSAPSDSNIQGQQQQPLPSESVATEVVVAATEVMVEVGAPEKPVVEPEEAVSANTRPSADSPPSQGPSRLPTQQKQPTQQTLDAPSPVAQASVSQPEEPSPAAAQGHSQSPVRCPVVHHTSPSSTLPVATSPSVAKSSDVPSVTSLSEQHSPSIQQNHHGAAGEMPPPPLPSSRAKKTTQSKAPKDIRVNLETKRPASVRDDKRNAAWLTWKITQDLRRITGREPFTPPTKSTSTSPPTMPPRTKKSTKSRKSAPAALASTEPAATGFVTTIDRAESNSTQDSQEQTIAQEQESEMEFSNDSVFGGEMHNHSSPNPSVTPAPMDVSLAESHQPESSISALVKTRKRKRQSWKMVRGVEVLVDLDDEDAAITENARRILKENMPPRKKPEVPKLKPGETMKKRMTLSPIIPTRPGSPIALPGPWQKAAFEEGFSTTDRLIAQLNSELDPFGYPQTTLNAGNMTAGSGFGETDRLIALASRPTTPVPPMNPFFQLPPPRRDQHTYNPPIQQIHTQRPVANLPDVHLYSPSTAAVDLARRPQPLEPQFMNSGLVSEITPSVGSPPPHSPPETNFACRSIGSNADTSMDANAQVNMQMHPMRMSHPDWNNNHGNQSFSGISARNMNGGTGMHANMMHGSMMTRTPDTMAVQTKLPDNGPHKAVQIHLANGGPHKIQDKPDLFPFQNQYPVLNPDAFQYKGDPLVRHLQYPPLWLEQSYNRSQFALRTPSPGMHPPAPGQGGFGRYNLDGTPVPPAGAHSSPNEQLRREQEDAIMQEAANRQEAAIGMLTMMGRGGAQPETITQQQPTMHQRAMMQQHAIVQQTHFQQQAMSAMSLQHATQQQRIMQQNMITPQGLHTPGHGKGMKQGQHGQVQVNTNQLVGH